MATVDSRFQAKATRYSIADSVGYQTATSLEVGFPVAMVLDLLDEKYLDDWGKVTSTRTSPATFFGSDGLLKVQGYNLLTWSSSFDTAWTLSGANWSGINSVAPDGTMTAKTAIYDTGTPYLQSSVITKAAATLQYTGTIYVKQNPAGGNLTITVDSGSTSNRGTVTFNIATMGAGTSLTSTGTFTANAPYNPVSVGNGWYRLGITVTTDAGTGVRFRPYWSSGTAALEIWGPQLEAGSTANLYSPTTTAANSAPRLDYDPATQLSVTGGELVTNGDFSSASGWTVGSEWTVSGGQASVVGTGAFANLQQGSGLTVGKTYRITFDVVSISGGALRVSVGGSALDTTTTTTGSKTLNIVAATTAWVVRMQVGSGVSATIDNISVQEVTFAPRGLLVEEQRVNLIPNSNAFNNNGALSSATFAQNAIDPAGTSTAWTITESATSANQYGIATNNGSATLTAAVHTASVFVKAGTNTRCQLCVSSSLSTDYANFLLTGSGSVTAATTLANCSIIALAGGWYRVSMVFTSLAATGSVVVGHINTATDIRIPLYLGTSRTLIAFGAQLEAGAFPTSYIPTTTASATRGADFALMNNTNFSSWYNQTQGTFVVEFDTVQSAPTATRRAIEVNDATDANRMLVGVTTLSNVRYLTTTGGSGNLQADLNQSVSAGGVITAAIAYSNNNFALSADGASPSPDTSGTVPTVDRLMIGYTPSGAANAMLNGHIRRLQFYSVALPSATHQSLTT